MTAAARSVNDVLAFLLELVAFAVLGLWGYRAGSAMPVKVALAVCVPPSAAVLWGLFAAPRATVALPLPAVLVVKAVVFGSAALALVPMAGRVPAIVFATVAALNVAIAVTAPS